MQKLKLFMLLLGCKPKGRHVEQHDIFFGIGHSLADLIPEINTFWPEGTHNLHIDAWREVNFVEGFEVNVLRKMPDAAVEGIDRLFFVNLGGYQENKFEEQHDILLTAQENRVAAVMAAKRTLFFQKNHFPGAKSHLDDKYGIDVDDLFEIEDILPETHKAKFTINLKRSETPETDIFHLGYLKLSQIK